uniref:Uncharacterized protein n=1 Tax=Romanomermis culicivorax TaxID=13658 RepID=A0A915IU94_ROMCU
MNLAVQNFLKVELKGHKNLNGSGLTMIRFRQNVLCMLISMDYLPSPEHGPAVPYIKPGE